MNIFHPWLRLLTWKDGLVMRKNAFLQRRPHRSFRRTRRRDYKRALALPGYWSFTSQVWKMLWRNRRLFGLLIFMYAFITLLVGGVTNQGTYQQINDLLNQSFGEVIKGAWGSVGQAGLLLFSAFLSPGTITPQQQMYLTISGVMVWLITVWLLRELVAGRRPKLRDGIYSAGSPIIATLLVCLVAVIQLIPLGLIALAYTGVTVTGVLSEGLGMMFLWLLIGLVASLVLYWMTSTFIALVIVTLPGMYPMRAVQIAGDIVTGRRLRVLYRVLWMVLMLLLGWVAVMIPAILLDMGVKHLWPALTDAPFVPIMASLMSAASVVWASTYIYLLYRRIVDNDASTD